MRLESRTADDDRYSGDEADRRPRSVKETIARGTRTTRSGNARGEQER
jgi:hypothetical protein